MINRVFVMKKKGMKKYMRTCLMFISLFLINISYGADTPALQGNLSVSFNKEKGTYSIVRSGEIPMVINARLELRMRDRVINCSGADFTKEVTEDSFTNKLGSGNELIVHFKSTGQIPVAVDLIVRTYETITLTTIEAVVTNQSKEDLELMEISPLVTDNEEGSGFFFSPKIDDLRLLCYGYGIGDCGDLYFLKDELMEANAFWNLALYDPTESLGLTIGSLEFEQTETEIVMARHPESKNMKGLAGFELSINCSTNKKNTGRYFKTQKKTLLPGGWRKDGLKDGWYETQDKHGQYLLASGAEITSGQIAFILDSNPHQTLENWALYVQQINEIELNRPIPAGWSSWPEFFANINETKILNVAKAARKNHLQDFGFKLIQLDDGFQKMFGDWDGNVYFPHGMKWLAGEIEELGFQPGIWLGAYSISINHQIVEEHPDWLFHDISGNIQGLSYFNIFPTYGLDITHPEAKEWFTGMFREMSSDWGYSLFKLDLNLATIFETDRYYNLHITKGEAYRHGLRTIRSGIGEDASILECGVVSAAGLTDSWRTNEDIGASWFKYTTPRGTGRAVPKRYYMHNRLFYNDADHVVVREPLTIDQARVLASNVAMSGGPVLAGDDLTKLSKDRMNIIKQVMPSYGEAARPVDLFETNDPMISSLELQCDFENWQVLSVASWDQEKMVNRTVDLEEAGLEPDKEYLAFEFWEQKFLGKVSGTLELELRPTSVKVVALREITGHPQIIGTNRHITMGGVELDNVTWNPDDLSLTGTLKGGREHTFSLTVYVPSGYKLNEASADNTRSKITYLNSGLIRLDIDFGDKAVRTFGLEFKQVQ